MQGAAPSEDANQRLRRMALAVFGATIAAFLATELTRGYRFPIPWPDEGSFLWQTLAFRDGFSLYAPELHSTREVMWMPPGFMVLEGLIFRLLPFSLGLSRFLSTLAICSALGCVLAMVRTSRVLLGHVLVASALFFSPIVLLAGNVARMESLVLLVTSAGFLLLRNQRVAGLGLLALSPLFHPNGAFPLLGGAIYWLFCVRGKRPVQRQDWYVLVAVAIAWAAYGVHVSMHFPDFLTDMDAQIRFKRFVSADDGGLDGRIKQLVVAIPALLLVGAVGVGHRVGARVGALATFAASLFVQTATAAGWLYEVYPVWAILLASLVVVEVAAQAFARSSLRPRVRDAGQVAMCLVVVAANALLVARSPFLARSLDRSVVVRDSWSPRYFFKDDHDAVVQQLSTLSDGVSRSIQFIPDADALFFERLRSPRLHFVEHTFFDFVPDVLVVHDSVWTPRWMRDLQLLKTFSMHPGKGPLEAHVIRTRDKTERWTIYRWK